MVDVLNLPVEYKGVEMEFPFRIVPQGYVYRFEVDVDGVPVVVEKDDSGEFRAIVEHAEQHGRLPERALLETIVVTLEKLVS